MYDVCVASGATYPASTWSFTGYGSEVVSWWLARELASRGLRVLLIACMQTERIPNVTLAPIPCTYGVVDNLTELTALKLFMKDVKQCKVIHDMSNSGVFHAYSHIVDGRSIITRNGYLPPLFNTRNTVVLSNAVKEYFKEKYGLNPEVVHYGLPVGEYPFSDRKGDYVLYVGRPHPSKGVDLIIKLAKMFPEEHFVLAWNPTAIDHFHYARHYQQLAEKMKVKNVHFLKLPSGWRGEWAKRVLMSRAKLFIQPTVYLEAFGLTAIEALATGTPLLLSTAGSGPEIVASSEVGVLVRNSLSLVEQAEEWQNKITDAIDLNELANVFESALKRKWNYLAIRRYVEERFSIKAMADKYLKLYELATEGGWE